MNHIKNLHRIIKNWVTNTLLAKIIIPIILTFIYFLVLGPTSVIAKIFFRKHLSKTANSTEANWSSVQENIDTLAELKKQS